MKKFTAYVFQSDLNRFLKGDKHIEYVELFRNKDCARDCVNRAWIKKVKVTITPTNNKDS